MRHKGYNSMSINFNDTDLRTASGVVLDTPQELAQTIANKAAAILGKADALVKDEANKLFYQNVLTIVEKYHDELKALNGSQRASYLDADLQSGGALAGGNTHFPISPIWVKFPPKIVASQNGGPITTLTDHEIFRLGELTSTIALMKTGYTDGAASATLSAAYSGGTSLQILSGSFSLNDRLTLSGGGFSALLKVTAVVVTPATTPVPPALPTPGFTTITVTVLAAPLGAIPIGGSVKNFFTGFTNTQRESGVSTHAEVFAYFKTLIVAEKDAISPFIASQKTALLSNDAIGAEAAAITTARNNVDSAKNLITAWDALALTGAGSKYGNTGIANLETMTTNRNAQAPARATAINTYLGSVVQDAEGAITGSGQYFTLGTWINLRINKSAGTLRIWYDYDQIITFIDASVAITAARKAEYDAYMLVKQITSNPNNTAVIGASDVTGLSPLDSIKIIDKATPSMVGIIQSIVGNIVTLNVPIPSTYTVANTARLIKLL